MSNNNNVNHAVYYCDGSCRPNPGYSGSGVFGYIYKEVKKSRSFKHPFHATLFFTEEGILPTRGQVELEVTHIVEIIKCINNPTSTNNEAELVATLEAIKHASTLPDLKSITIYTDSNYIVSAYNENIDKWKLNNWQRIDNKPIVHIKEWMLIDDYNRVLSESGIDLKIIWVKGHSDSYCNNISDTYSVIASNASRIQFEEKTEPFCETVLNQCITFDEFKKSFADKDFIYFFRDLYFSSGDIDDTNYCFLTNSENPLMIGKKNTESIFVANTGYVPSLISSVKKLYRNIPRNYVTTCCIKLSKLDNKDFFRLTNYIDIKYLVVKSKSSHSNTYSIVNDTTPFILENRADFPFIVNASSLFNRMAEIESDLTEFNNNLYVYDITDKLIKDNKFILSNKDKNLDFSTVVEKDIRFKQKLIVTIGYDIPSFLAMKNIEKEIDKILMIVETKPDSNFCTVYFNFVTTTRNIYTVNIENKYLRLTY